MAYLGPIGPSRPGNLQGTADNYNLSGQYVGPIGPSQPGFMQGTANNIPTGSVLGTTSGGTGGAAGGSGTLNTSSAPSGGLDPLYNDVFNSLDEQWSGLDQQAASQNTIAQNTYDTQKNTLSNTYSQNANDLQTGQTKALTDLGDTMRQQWQTGNQMLGTRGASDSSAAGAYSYALTKMGSKMRGDIMGDYQSRVTNLKSTYDTNIQNLDSWLSTQKAQISQWLSEAQNQLRGVRTDLQREKSQQAYNYALSMLQQAQQQAASQRSILDQWVANRSNSLGELVNGLNANSQNMPTFQGMNGLPQSGTNTGYNLFGMGYSNEDKNRTL